MYGNKKQKLERYAMKNLILYQRSDCLLISIAIDLYNVAEWIFAEYYLVAFIWNNLPDIAALSPTSFRNSFA
jgi:hypothetical protein